MTPSLSVVSRALAACILITLVVLAAHALAAQVFGLSGTWSYLLGGAVGVSTGTGLAALLFGRVSGDLDRLNNSASRLAGGDFKAEIPSCCSAGLDSLSASLTTVVGQLKLTLGNWRGLTEAILIPYAIVDRKGHLTFTNQMALDMLERGGTPQGCVGMFFSEFFYGDRSRKALIVDVMDQNKGVVREVEFKNIKGNTRFIQAALSPLHDLDGNVSGGLCMYLDYTEIRRKEDQIVSQGERMVSAVRQIEEISGGLAQTSRALSTQVEGASRGAQLQNTRTEETSAAMGQMNETVSEVAKSASAAAERAGEAQAKAREGAAVVEKAVEAIRQVETVTGVLMHSMDGLSGQAEAIGRIMGVISDIADQTNLLALNAAIEAARAGDAGRGFAVVADEVRKLAEKTMTATKEVGQTVGEIQNGVRASIDGADQASQAVGRATELAGESGRALARIVELVVDTSDQVRAIAAAAEEQSSASDEISKAVEDVRRVSEETARDMGSAAQSVDALSRLADQLDGTVHSLSV
ncbi:methyl-accepting chemotaxis protein [Fundidesulfovibrio terrae]|uniref:methyl-accepting chemotaxis protein n=1 Tax=Fundidesulfovibrio terrae TaxID=2922866 RepID=UPI001FAE7D70|nr:methyl-accepting chemotaxis protein [Fundidesulfovibrio terrae]